MRILEKSSLSSTVPEASLVHSYNFIASLGPHLSLEGIALTIASKSMNIEDDSFAGRRINGVSVCHQHDLFTVLHYSELEDVLLRPGHLDVLRKGVFLVDHINNICCFKL